ncbi:MAG: hypothetical protein HOQ27_16500 [Dermatophilaceae bacterium]|nr:hypothetical protein [Dermatophilaceae bacterium]
MWSPGRSRRSATTPTASPTSSRSSEAYSTFTLTGKHVTPAGEAHKGSVVITPNATLRDLAGKLVLSGTVTVQLDPSGAWSVVLPCDSAGLNPSTGIGYTLTFRLLATGITPLAFTAPAEFAGTSVDLAQLTASSTPAPLPSTVIVGPRIDYDTDGTPYLV